MSQVLLLLLLLKYWKRILFTTLVVPLIIWYSLNSFVKFCVQKCHVLPHSQNERCLFVRVYEVAMLLPHSMMQFMWFKFMYYIPEWISVYILEFDLKLNFEMFHTSWIIVLNWLCHKCMWSLIVLSMFIYLCHVISLVKIWSGTLDYKI